MNQWRIVAGVAEVVDAAGLKPACLQGSAGSSPAARTIASVLKAGYNPSTTTLSPFQRGVREASGLSDLSYLSFPLVH